MRLEKGDMWDVFDEADLFCITTNGVTKRDGSLVMGAGMAKQAADRFPDLPRIAGLALSGDSPHRYFFLPLDGKPPFALFQTKLHFKSAAEMLLLDAAADLLRRWCREYDREYAESPRVHLNFPGIGLGRLDREKVLKTLEYRLPDCVTVWEKA